MKIVTRWRVVTWLGALVLSIVLVGCGASTNTSTTHGQAASAPSPTATATLAPTPMPTPNASQLAACGLHSPVGVVRLGDLLLTGPSFTLAYPSRKLPSSTPLAPFQLASQSEDTLDAQLPPDPAVNPNMTAGTGGFELDICNSSPTTTHVIHGVSVRINSITPYSGELDAWNSCDGVFDASTEQAGQAGCGGGFCPNEILKATFDTAASGANATITQLQSDKDIAGGCGSVVFGPLPVSLKSHQEISINIGIALPSTPATYTFAFGVAQDSAAAAYLPASRPTLLAPVAHKWTGEACTSSAMQSQIPAATSPTFYICPAS